MLTEGEVATQYGEVELTFSSYYKYSFSFDGVAPDGAEISADFGGDGDDIYRVRVSNNEKLKLGKPSEQWRCVRIEKDGVEIYNYLE